MNEATRDFPMRFIRATEKYCTLENHVPAPYFRKTFLVRKGIAKAVLLICGLGFYELWLNGHRLTKGALAPYFSVPDDILYYDEYSVAPYLVKGKNVLAVCLGNGLQNAVGGFVWGFDKARWRGSPQMALRLTLTARDGTEVSIESDDSFLTAPSPILFDDVRCGEYYDACMELPGWTEPDFNDQNWRTALAAPVPRGEARLCEAEPIIVEQELTPVAIEKEPDGYRYDFGVNSAGVCRLRIRGAQGQQLDFQHGETVVNGRLYTRNIKYGLHDYIQKDIYICKGEGEEVYTPTFTYHGFRYVLVRGITSKQAVPELLTFLIMHSDLKERGGFTCSDETVNKLQECTRRSDLSNFYYFPTDCPQRDKNGWTADASLSAEHVLLNLSPEKSYREWMRNICKAQNQKGALPGIVPTSGWGFGWGNGPVWDSVLFCLPYYTYIYRGDKQIVTECAAAMLRYLHYITTRIEDDGLIRCGSGDWNQAGRESESDCDAPLEFTDTAVTIENAGKAAYLFGEIGMTEQEKFARSIQKRLRRTVREKLLDLHTMMAEGNCQTTQALAIACGIFEPSECPAAFENLLRFIGQADGHIATGVLGARVLFHVLTAYGRSDLAYTMITRPDFPSYGNILARGATSLWESFQPEGGHIPSLNHHYWGDISGWFIQSLAGIRYNPYRNNWLEANICPSFVPQLSYASGFHIAPAGEISSSWKKDGQSVVLSVEMPADMSGKICLEPGWRLENGRSVCPAETGDYRIISK